ncbi:MAG: TDT family transporter [Proteobacteria bacterium]|nr:MAG: TDT family transporter [Pseudomonadota bacterium]
MKRLINNLTKLPVAVSGLALGTAGLGNVLAMEVNTNFRFICAMIAAIILVLVLIKKLAHPKLLWNEIAHPVLGSFVPAFDMCLMVIAELIANYSPLTGKVLWYSAIVIHLIFAISFLYHRLVDFDLNHILPSWFVPPVGIVVACVTGSKMNAPLITHVIFYGGCGLYLMMLPVMMYRLIFGDRIQDAQLPAFAIMGAPSSLCLAGYLTAFANPNPQLVGVLLAISLMMTSLVYISMIRINGLRIAFIPIYASFTFPLSIGATALIKYAHFIGIQSDFGRLWQTIGHIEMLVATGVVAWVLINMSKFVIKQVILAK